MHMSFLTLLTSLVDRAISTGLLMSRLELTNPLSCT